jgi:UDP-N-acetylmuramyl pentapeptide phosphotransferase/UDP-N-acetylglucosamine-1-phosphate transferase
MTLIGILAIVLPAVLVSYALTHAVIAASRRGALIDHPNERSSHAVPTPRGGGLAIVVVVCGGLIALLLMRASSGLSVVIFAAASGTIALVGFIDDIRSLSARVRLFIQLLVALALTLALGVGRAGFAPERSPTITFVLVGVTVFWIVAMTNGFNFMDGIDGIAGTMAVVAGLYFAVEGARRETPVVAAAGLLIAAAAAGFLAHNWPPARIFMGDVGSGFLGFSLAALPLLARDHSIQLFTGIALVLWPFLFDTAFTILRRLRNRENVFAAHRSHLYQRLVIAGWPHLHVTLLYAGLALIGAAIALSRVMVLTIVIPAAAFALWAMTTNVERRSVRSA